MILIITTSDSITAIALITVMITTASIITVRITILNKNRENNDNNDNAGNTDIYSR